MTSNYGLPLGSKNDPWLTTDSKSVGATVLQPQGTIRLNSTNNPMSLKEDSKLQKECNPANTLIFTSGDPERRLT